MYCLRVDSSCIFIKNDASPAIQTTKDLGFAICTPMEECYFLIKESLTYSKHVLCDTLLSKEENEIKELYDYSYYGIL